MPTMRRVGTMLIALGLTTCAAFAAGGPLFPGAQYPAGNGALSVAIGDLDGDQVPDLAVGNAYSNKREISDGGKSCNRESGRR